MLFYRLLHTIYDNPYPITHNPYLITLPKTLPQGLQKTPATPDVPTHNQWQY